MKLQMKTSSSMLLFFLFSASVEANWSEHALVIQDPPTTVPT